MDTIGRETRSGRWTGGSAGVLIVAAGVAEIMAQLARWAPCIGDYSASACGRLQDHRYDFFLPTPPWIPTGAGPQYVPAAAWVPVFGAAELTGTAFVLLAAAMLLTTGLLVDRSSRRTPVAVAAWSVMIGLVLLVGAVNIISGTTGVTFGVTRPVAVAWMLLGPVLGVGLAAWLLTRGDAGVRCRLMAGVVVVVPFRGSIPEYILASMTYSSYDSPPFEGVPAAVAFVLLGGALVLFALRRRPALRT